MTRISASEVFRPKLSTRLAVGSEDLQAAQRLRYEVFVAEMGATGGMVDHSARREVDQFDVAAEHLLLCDENRPQDTQVIGVYRLLTQEGAARVGGYYSDAEFDLSPLINSNRKLLELGRTCLHADYRGGTALAHLWQALAAYVQNHAIEVLFGTASFGSSDVESLKLPISYLHQAYLAADELRVVSRYTPQPVFYPPGRIDRVAAMRETPALIKAYLRMGGKIGQGVFVDKPFNTTDVCMILDTKALNVKQAAYYTVGALK